MRYYEETKTRVLFSVCYTNSTRVIVTLVRDQDLVENHGLVFLLGERSEKSW